MEAAVAVGAKEAFAMALHHVSLELRLLEEYVWLLARGRSWVGKGALLRAGLILAYLAEKTLFVRSHNMLPQLVAVRERHQASLLVERAGVLESV